MAFLKPSRARAERVAHRLARIGIMQKRTPRPRGPRKVE